MGSLSLILGSTQQFLSFPRGLPHPQHCWLGWCWLLFLPGTQILSLLSLWALPRPQSAVSVPRDFEGCSTLRKYLGQLHFLQSRIPMGAGQDAAVPVTW